MDGEIPHAGCNHHFAVVVVVVVASTLRGKQHIVVRPNYPCGANRQ